MERMISVLALLILTKTRPTTAFAVSSTFHRHSISVFPRSDHIGNTSGRRISGKHQPLSMYLDDFDTSVGFATTTFATLTSSSPLLTTASFTTEIIASIQLAASSPLSELSNSVQSAVSIIVDPYLEAELFSDIAHVTLDMATLFFGPETAAIRLLAVIGRMCLMTADYVPDHSILGTELAFQLSMLSIASYGLMKSTLPILTAASTVTSTRDMRTYLLLFRETGLTWVQYKVMVALAFDWIEVKPGCVITSDEEEAIADEHMYWLYSGEAHVHSQDRLLQTVRRDNKDPRRSDAHSIALLGEMGFARGLDNYKGTSEKINRKNASKGESPPLSFSMTTTKAGGLNGATLLRMNTSKMTFLMENDEKMAKSIRCLCMTKMQEKFSALLDIDDIQ